MSPEPFTTTDPAVEHALQHYLKHPPPYLVRELATVSSFVVSYAFDLSFVEHLSDAQSLGVCGSEFTAESLQVLPKVSSFRGDYSPVQTLASFANHQRLTRLNLDGCLVSDLSPLLTQLPRLDVVTLRGCPLSDESYYEHLPSLKEKVNPEWDEPITVTHCPEADWKVGRLIQSRGIAVCYMGSSGKVLAPGLTYSKLPDLHSYDVTHDEVRAVLDQVEDGDLKGFMDRCRDIANAR